MNQKSRQNAKNAIQNAENAMNNANFGYDYRNNTLQEQYQQCHIWAHHRWNK